LVDIYDQNSLGGLGSQSGLIYGNDPTKSDVTLAWPPTTPAYRSKKPEIYLSF
jgi:hypothetical protein